MEIEYNPRKKLIVHEIVRYNVEDLLKLQALGVQVGGMTPPLYWVDGVILRFNSMIPSETTNKELLKGILHWDHVSFALMLKYERERKLEGNITVPIIDVSANKTFWEVSKFLKQVKLE